MTAREDIIELLSEHEKLSRYQISKQLEDKAEPVIMRALDKLKREGFVLETQTQRKGIPKIRVYQLNKSTERRQLQLESAISRDVLLYLRSCTKPRTNRDIATAIECNVQAVRRTTEELNGFGLLKVGKTNRWSRWITTYWLLERGDPPTTQPELPV